jgi:hypothetical protein
MADDVLALMVLNRVLRAKEEALLVNWQGWTRLYAVALDEIAEMCSAVYKLPVEKGALDT